MNVREFSWAPTRSLVCLARRFLPPAVKSVLRRLMRSVVLTVRMLNGAEVARKREDRIIYQHIVARTNGIVAAGPFEGLVWIQGASWQWSPPYLAGGYEAELHGTIEHLIAAEPTTVIDVGCAEGYYAVGFARRLPHAHVFAFDSASSSRQICRQLAMSNGVTSRVTVEGTCTAELLSALCDERTLLILDCEGAEVELLRPDIAPNLARVTILVELHDFIDSTISATIVERLGSSHHIQMFTSVKRICSDWDAVSSLPPALADRALDEGRPTKPHPMQWALLEPLTAQARC